MPCNHRVGGGVSRRGDSGSCSSRSGSVSGASNSVWLGGAGLSSPSASGAGLGISDLGSGAVLGRRKAPPHPPEKKIQINNINLGIDTPS